MSCFLIPSGSTFKYLVKWTSSFLQISTETIQTETIQLRAETEPNRAETAQVRDESEPNRVRVETNEDAELNEFEFFEAKIEETSKLQNVDFDLEKFQVSLYFIH